MIGQQLGRAAGQVRHFKSGKASITADVGAAGLLYCFYP